MKRTNLAKLLRDAIVSLTIAAVMFVAIEVLIGFALPQNLRTTFLGGTSLGLADDVVGHVNQPNAHALVEGPEFSVEYRISEQGFRDAAVYPPRKPEGVTRVLLLGNSFTFGASNPYEDIWPVNVENDLLKAGQKIELIKAGVPAFDTRTEVLYLERLYDLYRPDIVVFVFLPNDLFTNSPIADSDAKAVSEPAEKPDDGVRVATGKKSSLHTLTLAKRILMSNDRAYTQLYLMTGRKPYFESNAGETLAGQFRETGKLFARAHRFCAAKGCEFVVLSIPQQFQVLAQARQISVDGIDPTHIDTEFKQLADEEGFLWIPLLSELAEFYRQNGEDLYFRYDGHLNRAGNQVVAASVTDALMNILKSRAATENAAVPTR